MLSWLDIHMVLIPINPRGRPHPFPDICTFLCDIQKCTLQNRILKIVQKLLVLLRDQSPSPIFTRDTFRWEWDMMYHHSIKKFYLETYFWIKPAIYHLNLILSHSKISKSSLSSWDSGWYLSITYDQLVHNCTIFLCSLDVGNIKMINAEVPLKRRKIIFLGRHGICQNFYTTGFSGQKFYTVNFT